METRFNFALIGAATIVAVCAVFGFVYWLSGPDRTVQYRTYELVFPGSVSGLARGSAVQFNGLKVGEVKRLAISNEEPSRVDVLVDINKKTPVKTNTKARLEQNGLITGVWVVSLTGGTPGAPEVQVQPGQRYPRIMAERSGIQNLQDNLERISTLAPDVLEKFGYVFTANSGPLAETAWNAENFTKTLSDNSRVIENTLRDGRDLTHSLKAVSARLDRLLGDGGLNAQNNKTQNNAAGDAAAFASINRFSASGLRQYERLAIDARKAVNTFDRTVQSLQRDPQQVIFGVTPAAPAQQGR